MEENHGTGPKDAAATHPETNTEIRKLLHDMNNGLEIIIQATYLIGTLEMKEDGKQWVKLLEQGVDQVAKLNLQLRDAIRKQLD